MAVCVQQRSDFNFIVQSTKLSKLISGSLHYSNGRNVRDKKMTNECYFATFLMYICENKDPCMPFMPLRSRSRIIPKYKQSFILLSVYGLSMPKMIQIMHQRQERIQTSCHSVTSHFKSKSIFRVKINRCLLRCSPCSISLAHGRGHAARAQLTILMSSTPNIPYEKVCRGLYGKSAYHF